MAGVDLRTVQELAGHKDIKMTVRYAHLAPAHKLAAVDGQSRYRKFGQGYKWKFCLLAALRWL
jgi:site-specific recombinase XerC